MISLRDLPFLVAALIVASAITIVASLIVRKRTSNVAAAALGSGLVFPVLVVVLSVLQLALDDSKSPDAAGMAAAGLFMLAFISMPFTLLVGVLATLYLRRSVSKPD